jgi:hypothetical protein
VKSALVHIQKTPKIAKDILNIGLNMLKEKVSGTVIWHVLLGFSHLCLDKEKLAGPFEETKFSDRLNDFHDYFAQLNPNGNLNY